MNCDEKMSFSTRREARAAAATLKWRHGETMQIYKCRDCEQWHLASS